MNALPTTARAAWETLQRISTALEDPERRTEALAELRALADAARDQKEGAPLRLAVIEPAVGSMQERIEVLLLPTIFAPEDWAHTFLEGLLKIPLDEYDGKRLVELGTGSGWIPIALAKFTRLARIVGVDLNPQARAVAVCNAWLNCDEEQIARLDFGESDLLRGLPQDERWDFIVGCIPQVLRTEGIEAPQDEEAALYDLSNYCAIQNVYEDHFGLGLIARLLDECPEHLAPGGRLLLNLAGRPGRSIIERMFSRRGFSTGVLVARRVRQAADTDIRPLVALEQRTGREFEFFVHQHSAEPIRAETALGWMEAGEPIWHEVAVWEARLALPREIRRLRTALREMGAAWLLDELDLGAASQEQLDFVASLAERLASDPVVPYAHEAGDGSFRSQIARYLERFFDLRLGEEEIFVAPERAQAVHSLLLATCDPGDRVLISRNVHDTYAPALAKAGVHAVVTNDTLREIRRLLGAFDVKMVILSVEASERTNLSALRQIIDEAAARGILVVLDESPFFHITSGVEPRTLFEFLAREPHRPNLVVLYGLIKNAVFPDFELTLLLPVPQPLHGDLEVAAEVTYSRIATPVQWLYERLFAELLAFRISFEPGGEPAPRHAPGVPLPRSSRIQRIAAFPAFAPRIFDPADPRLIRLDYGENEGRIPQQLAEGLVAAAAAPRDAGSAHGLEEAIAAYLLETRGLRWPLDGIVLGQGVWPLVHDLFRALAERLGRSPRIHLVTPCYGILPPTVVAAGGQPIPGSLQALYASDERPDAVVISQPANPEGRYLSREELVELAAWTQARNCLLISDEIFGLVNLGQPGAETVRSPVGLEQAVPGIADRTVVLGGLSKEFAAGGARVGWLATRDRELAAQVRSLALAGVQLPLARAASHLYAAFARYESGQLIHPRRHQALRAHLTAMCRELGAKRASIAAAFGMDANDGEAGGLFLAPDVRPLVGKRIDGETIRADDLPRLIYRHTGVVVNGGDWCGDPDRLRAVYSIPDEKVRQAAERLRAFFTSVED